jgi:hypothetical protein
MLMKRIHHALILVLLATPGLLAQQASSFEQLQMLVKPDDTVIVRTFSGSETRGKIAALSPAMLRLIVDGIPQESTPADVLEIRQRRGDSLANGAKIGAIAGAAFGVLSAIVICAEESNCAEWAVGALSLYTLLGVGTGVGLDALIVRQQTIYRAPARSSGNNFRISPLLTRDRKGLTLSFNF